MQKRRDSTRSGDCRILAISGLQHLCDRDGALPDVKESGTAVWHGCPCSGRSDVRIRRMAGWGVSVRRAVLMFLLFLGAQVSGRSYDTFCALAFAAVALL